MGCHDIEIMQYKVDVIHCGAMGMSRYNLQKHLENERCPIHSDSAFYKPKTPTYSLMYAKHKATYK